MKNVPKWLTETLDKEDFKCPHCGTKFDSNKIMSLGIRHSVRDLKREVLFLEYLCVKCKKQTDLEFDSMGLEQFAREITDDIESDIVDYIEKKLEESELDPDDLESGEYKKLVKDYFEKEDEVSPPKKSRITVKEIKEARKMLNRIKTHDEFLMEIGLSEEQIEGYRYKKDGKDER